MPYVFVNDNLIYFAHVPKAAGSTVEDYLAERFGRLSLLNRNWYRVRRLIPEASRISPQHMTADSVLHYLPRSPDWSFATVRNPHSRLASEFRMHHGARRFRKHLAKFGYEFHANLLLSAAKLDPAVFDNHVRPQSDIVPTGADVFRLEDGLDKLVATIEHKYGKSSSDVMLSPQYEHNYQVNTVPSERLNLRVHRFYAKDFERFDYSFGQSYRKTRLADRLAAVLAAIIAPLIVALDRRGHL